MITNLNESSKKSVYKNKITGFWTFFCNPKYWAIDSFLSSAKPDMLSEYRITTWQTKYFEKGQLGVIRVGTDARTRLQLEGRSKLQRGIYAVVEIMSDPFLINIGKNGFVIEKQKGENGRLVVPIKYIKNYIGHPILLDDICDDLIIKNDPYLLKGMQAASMPLQEDAFNRILLYGEEGNAL